MQFRFLILAATLSLCLSARSTAAMEAVINTSAGNITVDLEFQKAPRTVANFISLAGGTRTWIDSTSGSVRHDTFFDGLAIYDTIDTPTAKMAFFGSRTNTPDDDPGYNFRDEFDPTLTHQPYTIAMRNSGPNTNGCQFYFNGSLAQPSRDNINPVFGSIIDAASRSTIDTIISSPPGSVVISSVAINKTDPAASSFDANAQGLPDVTSLQPALIVVPGSTVAADLTPAPQSELRVFQSTDLDSWQPQIQSYLGASDPAPGPTVSLGTIPPSRSFYKFSSTSYPDAHAVTNFANRTLTIVTPSTDQIILVFDATGQGGTYQNLVFDVPFFTGSFEVRPEVPATYGPYAFRLLLYLFDEELGGAPFLLIRGGYDTANPANTAGRHVTLFMDASMDPVFEDHGPLTLVAP